MTQKIEAITENESDWLDRFIRVMKKKPQALCLKIDSQSCSGNVEVFSETGKKFAKPQLSWIQDVQSMLADFPNSPQFWLLSNIDGLNVGKGQPTFFSSTTVGTGGATGSLADNFSSHYIYQIDVDYCDISEEEREECESVEFNTNLGSLKILNINA